MHKLIITGTKGFDNYPFLKHKLNDLLKDKTDIVIVSGEDDCGTCGEKYAVEHDLDICSFPIDWERYGKKAAIMRNNLMYDFADSCLIFWDGKSQDTGYAVGTAKKKDIEFKIIRY